MLGLVFFGGLALLFWATAQLSSLSFTPKPSQEVWFAAASGLTKGDPVYVLGMRNGQVTNVELVEDQSPRIRVTVELDRPVQFRRDVSFKIVDANLLGGRQLDIDPGSSNELLPEGTRQIGDDPRGLMESLGAADISGTVASIKNAFDRVQDPTGTLGALLHERTLYDELVGAATGLRETFDAVRNQRGAIGRAIHDPRIGEDLAMVLAQLRAFASTLNQSESVVGRLLRDAQLGDAIAATLLDIRDLVADLRSGRGLAGRLLTDAKLGDDAASAISSLASVARKIDDPNAGLLGGLIGDSVWRGRVNDTLADISDFTRKLNEGPGLIAQLVNDPTLPVKLTRVLNQVSRAIEDAREAAPVSSFFQVLTAAF